jgi:hypothetical protein
MHQVWGNYVLTSWEINHGSQGLATLPFTTTDRGQNDYKIPPKLNFNGIGHVAYHYTSTKVTTFYSNPTYCWISMGSNGACH